MNKGEIQDDKVKLASLSSKKYDSGKHDVKEDKEIGSQFFGRKYTEFSFSQIKLEAWYA